MSENLLQFEELAFRYPQASKPVIEGFNLNVPDGSITGILGPNGAGKTTLLRLALGVYSPIAGQISLKGKPLSHYSRKEIGQIVGFVPQTEHNPFEFSLLEYVLLGRAPYLPPLGLPGDEDYRIAEQALEQVGIYPLRHRSVVNISGGEFQLVLIARALTQQPSLLLLDEPTSHLDIGNKGRLVELLRKLSDQGVTIIMTTHEPDFVSALATDLVLMRQGAILETGSFDKVFNTTSLTRLYGYDISVIDHSGHRTVVWGQRG